ncbi:MAG: FkbM family methyltransferase [Candidatus Margulisiibacteriota bacterium]|nr:FkbM family methyltransferase [Candidatus Margulisiibacteriota bacterium]
MQSVKDVLSVLLEKRGQYLKGKIDKKNYMEDMFEIHKRLFEYPGLLADSLINKIEINAEQVIFTIRNGNNNIMLCCDKREAHSLPMSFLNLSSVETEENKMILQLIQPGDVVFDIGANIGWYTISILLARKGTSVYSFEPIKSSYQYLLKNMELNNQKTEKAYNIGLSDENNMIDFFFDIKCATASSLANLREDKCTVKETCEVKRLDDFLKTIPSVSKLDFVKCDVEGAELFVFKGAIETIGKFKPIVFSEILRKWSKKMGYHPNDIIDLFRSIDYECHVINKGKIEKFGSVDEDTEYTNYLFFHNKKHAGIVKRLL